MHGKEDGKGEEIVTILSAPFHLVDSQGHHDEYRDTESNVHEQKVACRGMEFGASKAVDPEFNVDASCEAALLVGGVAMSIEGEVQRDLGECPDW